MATRSQKIPTAELRQLDGMHEFAGRCAARDAWPWQAGMSWAATVVGTTDAAAVAECYALWLKGWLSQSSKMSGEKPPEFLMKLQELLPQMVNV